jgi:hypothetical protein
LLLNLLQKPDDVHLLDAENRDSRIPIRG